MKAVTRKILIAAVLAVAFSASFAMRYQPAQFGYDLHEYDPFFNYRATSFLAENGLAAYMDWHDELSWYDKGRNISEKSQVMLHVTAAAAYGAFGGGTDLYDFAVIFPAVVGSLTVLAVFALVRLVAGTAAGLAAALLFSVALPVILRGLLGWFKSEPLGVLYGLVALCLLLYAFRPAGRYRAAALAAAGGAVSMLAVSAWGGAMFFMLAASLFFLTLPFAGVPPRRAAFVMLPFVAAALAVSLFFERPGPDFAASFVGLALSASAAAALITALVRAKSPPARSARNGAMAMAAILAAGAALAAAGPAADVSSSWVERYVYSVAPFLALPDAPWASVAEHTVPDKNLSFYYHSVMMIPALAGAWHLMRGRLRNPMMACFVLSFAPLGVYMGASSVRLELFASLSLLMLASVGVSALLSSFDRARLRYAAAGGMALMLAAPVALPPGQSWAETAAVPPTILNGGTLFQDSFPDWPAALAWIKFNTPPGSVVASWWDYGYWIQAVAERPTLADNSTLGWRTIGNMATALLSEPDEAWEYFTEAGADYVVISTAAELYYLDGAPVYSLEGGGEESKLPWIIYMAGIDEEDLLYPDGISPHERFWETALGLMIPYEQRAFYLYEGAVSDRFEDGSLPLYEPLVKYPAGGDGPFRLAYASPSFVDGGDQVLAVMVYEVNDGYSPVPSG